MSNEKIENLAELLKDILSEEKKVEVDISKIPFFKFTADAGNGMLWVGGKKQHTRQFVFSIKPDRFFSSETIDLAKDKSLCINSIPVINETEIGPSVTKSNLKQVGRLNGLIVDGSLSVNQFLYYSAESDRLGIGTENPNAPLSIVDGNIELIFGAGENLNVGNVGTFNSADFSLVTDDTERLTITAGGDIVLGNRNQGPIKVSLLGSLAVDVNSPDPRAKLHVNGSIKFNDNLQLSGTSAPSGGSFTSGDIVWNSNPQPRGHIGWVCTKGGNPGSWSPFGQIL